MSDKITSQMAKQIARRFLAILAVVSSAACATSSVKQQGIDQAISHIVVQEIDALRSNTELDTVSAVVVTGDTSHEFHFGQLDNAAKPTSRTLYDIGSITKTHTGLLVAMAFQDGLIDLDDDVAQYVPEFVPVRIEGSDAPVTIRHLLTHVSGLPTDIACGETALRPQARLDCFMAHDQADLLARIRDTELLSEPGSEYLYSNAGIRILGLVVERVYQEPYDLLLKRLVFAKTGQEDTHAFLTDEDRDRWQIGAHENGEPTPDASAYFNPAGGLKSTTADMSKYLSFWLDETNILAAEASRQLVGESDGLGRAYVWNTFRMDTEGQLYHGGGTFGTSSWISIYPREKLGIFLVTPYVSQTAQGELNVAANRIVARLRRDELVQTQ